MNEIEAVDIDRCSDLSQKERALYEAGVTRKRVCEEIMRLLNAVKKVETVEDGVVVTTEEPDLAMRDRGIEKAIKMFGDYKEFERVQKMEFNLQVNHIDIQERLNCISQN